MSKLNKLKHRWIWIFALLMPIVLLIFLGAFISIFLESNSVSVTIQGDEVDEVIEIKSDDALNTAVNDYLRQSRWGLRLSISSYSRGKIGIRGDHFRIRFFPKFTVVDFRFASDGRWWQFVGPKNKYSEQLENLIRSAFK